MSASDLAEIIEQYHQAVAAVGRGDPEPAEKLFSRRDDVTLANPFGRRSVDGIRSLRPSGAPGLHRVAENRLQVLWLGAGGIPEVDLVMTTMKLISVILGERVHHVQSAGLIGEWADVHDLD